MCVLPDPDLTELQPQDAPRDLTLSHVAYLKIAEGCSKSCTYCIIPKLRGKQKSRPPEDIVAEATRLINGGVNELVLVAQDTTAYGNDLPNRTDLSRLMQNLANIRIDDLNRKIPPWLRVLYGHPESIENSLIETMATNGQICSYFDIPIQHVSPGILRHMGRRYTKDNLYRLFDRIRDRVADAVLRTTVIVGFPGETDDDFEELLQFVEDVRFDHLGVFIYSDSDDLASHQFPQHIPKALATDRYHQLMSAQSGISTENNRKYIGKAVKVLVEESLDNHLFVGRTNFQAPEVDGLTYINAAKMPFGLKIGGFADMRVTDTMEYDLMGELI
jgi:ribosomal protein S12 methylthiotransferase